MIVVGVSYEISEDHQPFGLAVGTVFANSETRNIEGPIRGLQIEKRVGCYLERS